MAADREGQDPWRKFHVTLGILFVPGVILLLIAGGLIWAINDLGLYDRGFEKYNISRHTGITPGGLHEAGADIRGYFNSAAEPLLVTAQVYGEEREIFNHREVEHMRDVKGLVRGVYLAGGDCRGILRIWGGVYAKTGLDVALGRGRDPGNAGGVRGGGGGWVWLAVPDFPPNQLFQRPVDVGPAHRLSADHVSVGVLVRCHPQGCGHRRHGSRVVDSGSCRRVALPAPEGYGRCAPSGVRRGRQSPFNAVVREVLTRV